MLTIDALHLRLPAGFERRADTLVRLVARELSRVHAVNEGTHHVPSAHLSLHVDLSLPDGEVASRIAHALVSHVRGAVETGRVEEEGGRGW
ncbi:hypothetical protein [Corallococcus exiguus]|uniref:Uncharacterized protein n=1 Tax=Corallococcus exiguus TaxID=83462 RepID=A0A7X4YG67_9BACT|nr:hypothetical protein [Corallococcus exiguus]NBC43837.1 hypothetical protein [Corallococcus exiguus]TNV53373.1 hypothetical protein FH620_35805 [Corallococcus exiguus]